MEAHPAGGLAARLRARTLEERLAAARRMQRRHLENRRQWRLCQVGVDRLFHGACDVLGNRRRRVDVAAGPSSHKVGSSAAGPSYHKVGSSSSVARDVMTAEAALLDHIARHGKSAAAPAPPVIILSDDETNEEIDWTALMAEDE